MKTKTGFKKGELVRVRGVLFEVNTMDGVYWLNERKGIPPLAPGTKVPKL